MDLKEIQNLIKFVARSGAAEVNLETENFKINIKTDAAYAPTEGAVPQIISMPQAQQAVAAPAPVAAPAAQAPAPAATSGNDAAAEDDSKYITIKSPMIGTFYRRPSPDKDIFVNVGDEITPGSVVCIIEAMKLFNEIESEVSGKVVKILVDDQTPVEYDQPLFLIDPS
jgi:acetyl-CoA carboxylase biotin carboxyl carrier protein